MASHPEGLQRGQDGVVRCSWAGNDSEYLRYHDEEWGFPVSDDRRMFEKICLEGFQAGLSWLTILRKRGAFRSAFAGFDVNEVSRFRARDVERLLKDAAIVRHRGKIESTVNNARRVLEVAREHGSLAAYLWAFEPRPEKRPARLTWAVLRTMSSTPESTALSKDLKRRGFTFVGPTTIYAFMQGVGLVNDHVEGCAIRPRVEKARTVFRRPKPDR